MLQMRALRNFRYTLLIGFVVLVVAACGNAIQRSQPPISSVPSSPTNGENGPGVSASTAAGPESGGNKAALCGFISDIDKAATAADSPAERLDVLKTFQPRFHQAIADAPDSVKGYMRTMVDAFESTIQGKALSPALMDSSGEAGYQLDSYCGRTSPS